MESSINSQQTQLEVVSYDVFVSYAEENRTWVEGYLLDALKENGISVLIQTNFQLGRPRLLEFERAIKQSHRVVLVLSPAYFASNYNEFVDLLVQSYGLETQTWPVIPLLLEFTQLPTRLSMLNGLKATTQEEAAEALERLCAEFKKPFPPPLVKPSCPYPGMRSFEEKEAKYFFGRDQQVDELAQRMRHQKFILIIGPSGSGKSSLVSAGLLPKLHKQEEKWQVLSVRPSDRLSKKPEEVVDVLKLLINQEKKLIDGQTTYPSTIDKTLLVVDQFEEVFTTYSTEKQSEFITQLNALRKQRFHVILTMRADYYPDLMNSELWPVSAGERMEVTPLKGEALREAITQPASQVGVHLESALVERLLADAANEPGVLPLVQETMQLLWEKMERRYISVSMYEQLGRGNKSGLAQALSIKADATFDSMPAEKQKIARRVFLRLVQFNEGRPHTRRKLSKDELKSSTDDTVAFYDCLKYLADHRLLTSSGEEKDNERKVDIAHEILITAWPRLQTWIIERQEAEQLRRRLEDKADEWVRLGGNGGLLDEVELLEAERWISSPEATELGYSANLEKLVEQSRTTIRKEKQRKVRNQRLIIGGTLFLAIFFGILAYLMYESRKESQHQLAISYWTNSVIARKKDNGLEYLHLMAEAINNSRSKDFTDYLMIDVQSNLPQIGLVLYDYSKTIVGKDAGSIEDKVLTWSRDENGGSIAKLWDASNGKPAWQPVKTKGAIDGASISSDESRFITWKRDENGGSEVQLWEASSGKPVGIPLKIEGEIDGASISSDGSRFITWKRDKNGGSEVQLWEASSGKPVGIPLKIEEAINGASISGDGSRFITWNNIGTQLWEASSGKPIGVFMYQWSAISKVTFSRDGKRVITLSLDSIAQLWEVSSGKPVGELIKHGYEGIFEDPIFSPDESRLLTRKRDGSIQLWDANSGDLIGKAITYESSIDKVFFSRDGSQLLISSYDSDGNRANSKVQLWEASSGKPVGIPLKIEGEIDGASISSDGSRFITWKRDKNGGSEVQLWEASSGKPVGIPLKIEGEIGGSIFSNDRSRLIIWNRFGMVQLWDANNNKPIGELIKYERYIGSNPIRYVDNPIFSSDGSRILTWNRDGTVQLWNANNGEPIGELIKHESTIFKSSFSRAGNRFLTWSIDGTTQLWEASSGKPIGQPIKHENDFDVPIFSNDGSRILTWYRDGRVQLWDASSGKPIGIPLKTEGAIRETIFSRDGSRLLIISHDSDGNSRVQLWDANSGVPVGELIKPEHGDNGVSFSRDGSRFITWGRDKDGSSIVQLWDARSGKLIRKSMRRGEIIREANITSDGSRILSWSRDGAIKMWDFEADLDIPASLFLLQLQCFTGTYLNTNSLEINIFSMDEWQQKKKEYEQKARDHYQKCQHPKANLWRRFNLDEAKKMRPEVQ